MKHTSEIMDLCVSCVYNLFARQARLHSIKFSFINQITVTVFSSHSPVNVVIERFDRANETLLYQSVFRS